jgi:hypothetical protein
MRTLVVLAVSAIVMLLMVFPTMGVVCEDRVHGNHHRCDTLNFGFAAVDAPAWMPNFNPGNEYD